MTSEPPRLRPRQWELLERFAAIEERHDAQQASQAIHVMFSAGGAHIVRPGVASAEIEGGDLAAIRHAGALDEESWTRSLAVIRVSQRGYDLIEGRRRAQGIPTAEEKVEAYRRQRRWLAGRVASVARWVVLLLGIAGVVWSFVSGSAAYAVIGLVGAIFGFPVTGLADRVHAWLTERIDRWLLGVFEQDAGDTR